MNRTDKQLGETEILQIMEEGCILHLGLSSQEEKYPYVLPMNYGFDEENNQIFLHCSSVAGKRAKMIDDNPNCCFQIDVGSHPLIYEGQPGCNATCVYRSVVGYGEISYVEEFDEKVEALNLIMKQNAPEHMKETSDWGFTKKAVNSTKVISISISDWSGKQSPPPEKEDDL